MNEPGGFLTDFHRSGIIPKAHVEGVIRDFNSSLNCSNSVLMSSCLQLVQVMQAEGQIYHDEGKFNFAEKCYSSALEALKLTKQRRGVDVLSAEDLFQFWPNRSSARFQQGKFQDALQDAERSIEMDSGSVKGYWRASQACKAVSNYQEAALYILKFLNRPEATHEDFPDLITELASIVTQIKGEKQWQICGEMEPSMLFTPSLQVWTKIIEKLTEIDDYDALGILTIGMCSNDQVPHTVLQEMADMPGLSYNCVNLGRMLSVLSQKEGTKAWHLKLAEFVVRRQADINTLKHDFAKPLLVITTTFSIEGDVPSFLSLGWDKVLPEDYDESDLDGNTPAHALVKAEKFNVWKREVICNDLLSHGCLTTEKDKEGKLPHQYVSSDVRVHEWLKTASQKPGEGVLRRLRQIREKGSTALKDRKLTEALQLYDKALNITNSFQELLPEAAVLHSNKAAVYLQMKKYSEAVAAADESLKADPSVYKALFHKGQALTKLGQYENAFQAFMMGSKEADEESFRFEFVSEAASLLSEIPGNVRHSLMKAYEEVFRLWWPKLLEYLTTNKYWALVHIFILGPPFEDNDNRGIMGMCDASTAKLSTIFEAVNERDNQDNAAAVVSTLVVLGAPAESLTTSDKETYFHAAVRFCILTNDTRLLECILKMDTSNQSRASYDHEDHTPLHTLCLEAQKRHVDDSLSITMARMLFEKGIDVKAKDKYQRQAVDYAVAETELKKYVQQISAGEPYPTNDISTGRKNEEEALNAGTQKPPSPPRCDDCQRKIEVADRACKEKKYSDVYLNLVNVINVRHNSDPCHKDLRKKCIQRIATLLSHDVTPDVPESLMKISAEGCQKILNILAKSGKWRQLKLLVTEFRLNKGPKSLFNFAKSMSVVDLVQEPSLSNMETTRMDLINLLINNGASLETRTSSSALETSVKNSEWQVVSKLLDLKADPNGITLTAGDTPLHAALQLAFTIQPGNFSLLEKLKTIYDSDKNAYPDLSLSCQDVNGNTLLHIAVKCKFCEHSLQAVELLYKWGVPADLANFEGLLPIQYLTSANDRRAQYLRTSKGGTSKIQLSSVKSKTVDGKTEPSPSTEYGGARPKTSKFSARYTPLSSVQGNRDNALNILSAMRDVSYSYLNTDDLETIEEEGEEEDGNEEAQESEEEGEEDASTKESIEIETEAEVMTYEEDKEAVSSSSSSEETNIDIKAFDNLTWDVECTEEVWNMLRTKKEKKSVESGFENDKDEKMMRKERMPDDMKQVVVKKIQQLASGDWRNHLMRRVKGVPDSLQLYRITLPQGACVIWELAVAFSPRHSETAENILAAEDAENTSAGSAVKGGIIYSELIRIWSIVLTFADYKRALKKIVSSHHRGEKCIIQKILKGLSSNQLTGTSSSTRVPVLYVESDLDPAVNNKIEKGFQRRLYPPASPNKNEFHILKFYSFSSSLVAAVLSHTVTKIDFSFRVTDIEHAIIHLDSKSPILLLGRSGTGKTTCCLYRLWSVFLSYWEQATRSHAALLPRWDQPPQLDEGDDEDNQDEGNNEKSAKARVKSEERQAESSKSKEKTVDLMDVSDEENSDDSDGTHSTAPEEMEEENDNQQYDHLHQLFVTKNPVLCLEVEKNFLKLQHAADVMEEHNTTPSEPLPNTLQDVVELSYPLFLTSRQLLLMLDASVDGEPFFPRDEDLGLKVAIPGWGTQEDIFNIIPLGHESDEDDDEDTGGVKKDKRMHSAAGKQKQEADLRRECTYEVFAYEVWPKIAKKSKISCHPSLVWTEIMSFIKGSYEALHSEKGYLDKNQYLDLGKKRAANFSGDRTQVYDAFQHYNNYKQRHFLFDEADLVFKIYGRLRTMSFFPWVLHEIYVDETQDFTQAELALLVSLCHDPNKMFLTGDTAQSIMRGISFRFSDLRSLFHYAKMSAKSSERHLSAIKVPQKVHQLTHNYRSHTGILSLASAVLDILVELFPESFDRLKKDQGLFAGPKPVIIESSSPRDLALLLADNKRKTSHIEFGAHQAILVVSEKAKAELPEELTTGIVLTIYESKGLEFDDILLYNFFKDSPATKEWRVVTDFLTKLSRTEGKGTKEDNLVEIDIDVLTQFSGTRALKFDPNQHKILNSELKHLYTALTRARVNVWIFDEDDEKRRPMFQYFKARKLVTSMGSQDSEDAMDGQMFTDKSSAKEWRNSGDRFMQQKLYTVAAKCYRKAEQFEKERLALAYQAAQEASIMKSSPDAMREKYLQAGTQFVECGDVNKAALCFQNAKEHQLAALAFEKNGQFEEASKQYIQAKKLNDASRCLEQGGMFGNAIQVLVDGELFDRAIDCLHRYKMTVEMFQKEGRQLPAVLIENKPRDIDSEANLGLRSAEYHCQKKDYDKAFAAIHRVSDIDIQIDFLHKKGFWQKAAQILRKDGRTEEAARMMLKFGDIDKALEYCTAGFHKSLTAFIHLVLARKAENVNNIQLEDVKYHSTKALHMYVELDDLDGQAQAKLLLGKHTLDMKLIKEAQSDFGRAQPPNQLGKLESFHIRLTTMENISQLHDCLDVCDNVMLALSVLQVLLKPKAEDHQSQQSYLTFFGLELDANSQEVTWYPPQQPLCKDILNPSLCRTEAKGKKAVMQKSQAVRSLATHYVRRIKTWIGKLKEALDRMLPPLLPCKTYQEGFSCNCHHMHRPYESPKEEETAFSLLNCLVLVDYYLQTGKENLGDFEDLQAKLTSDKWEESKWDSVKEFLTFIFPAGPSALRSSAEHTHKLIGKLRNLKMTMIQVERYFCFLWDNPGHVGRGKFQNVMKERCKSTDWIVQALFFVSLLGFKNKLDVLQKFKDLESWLSKSERSWFDKIYNYALCAPAKSGGDGSVIEAIGSNFVESFQLLTCQESDPYKAIFSFTKMISPLGWRNKVFLMPKMNHLVFWLEVYFCITWFFIAKAKQMFKDKTSFFLPDSFLASLHLVSECIESSNKGKPPTIQQLVINRDFPQDLNKPGNMVLSRQNYLSNFLVGCNKYSPFSLIAYINNLCNQNPPNYLLAERIALLTAVLLLNIPENFVHPDYELPIRREIFKLKVTQTMPPRLASFLSQLKKASNYRDVGVATAAFLHQQGCGVLNKCEWVGRQNRPMQWQELKSSEYSTMNFYDGDIEELARQSIQEAQRDKRRIQDATSATDTEKDDKEDLQQFQEKMEAKHREVEEEDKRKRAAEAADQESRQEKLAQHEHEQGIKDGMAEAEELEREWPPLFQRQNQQQY